MLKFLLLASISVMIYSCGCNCKYNDYIPENNPLSIPEDLQTKTK